MLAIFKEMLIISIEGMADYFQFFESLYAIHYGFQSFQRLHIEFLFFGQVVYRLR